MYDEINEQEINDYIESEKTNKPMHLPGYKYCGPGTKVVTSIMGNIKPINNLDDGCQVHDIEYMEYAGDREKIEESDKKLMNVSKNWRNSSDYRKTRKGFMSKIYDWFSSNLVNKTFGAKKWLEKLKIVDPVEFAKKLSKKPVDLERKVGRMLKRKLEFNK